MVEQEFGAFSKEAGEEGRRGVGGEDILFLLGEDLALVYLGSQAEKGNAGYCIAESDSVGNGGGASVLREKGGVEAEDALRKLVNKRLWENLAIGG